ncbi:DUF1634 domain-containing protein [Pediococcus claussenii]|uniref:Integral membrane protein n=1 Tax=Pediococcus claussenii (strain ATCC BAA-344 / DSM 14800 / JCM 18046 / KCTC 3811 / LMG 21948 / P06) TaxID=701521 RepID=G8PDX6_PEDCP|nr:DUF1634 domain-containing protein [Pediococcus claussenii]AEV95461.1 hypothetical protein PECL_1228 [Pediococcus claussenii ATCC BAA-344]ANZ68986.1 hypothetical protein AYR57_01135 [Pediococcus claussenii]ANZ70802.1 hypothetical protein AYR58_01135 [Pediococcus claussenii]KRN20302.1 hypothetical protein IV79_GL000971 [Pediococcus claussenii]
MGNSVKKDEMKNVEIMIGRVLQIGVYISAFVIIVGILLWVFKGTGYNSDLLPKDFGTIWSGVLGLRAYAVVMFGIFLLILTPVLRVIVSIYAFAKENDRMYVWITTLVLVILIFGMVIGYAGK